MTATITFAARSNGSACRCAKTNRFWASAWARRSARNFLAARCFATRAGHAEVGYYPVRPTPAGLAVVETWPECVYQWHREGFDQPYGSELLAEGDIFEIQAIRFESAFALQFHPEVTHAMMHRWTTTGHDRLALPGAKPRPMHFTDRAVYDYSARLAQSFLERWLESARDRAGRSLLAAD